MNVEDIEDTYSSSVYLIQKEEKDDDDNDWVQHVPDLQHRQKQKKPFLVVSISKTSKIRLLILVFTVQCTEFMSKTSKIFKCTCIYFRRMIQTNTRLGLSFGADIGLEIVEDEEVEAEVDQIEADEEVAQMYKDAKKYHRKIMTGGFK